MYGAEIVSIEGNFDEALEIVKEISGACSNCSTISNAPVFCPSIRYGFTELTNSISSSFSANFDEALEIVKEIAENDEEIELVNSVNPYRIEGQKTGALIEVIDYLFSHGIL
jgi:threonine synthase